MYSRTTMLRARKALEDGRGWQRIAIDQHGGNEFTGSNLSTALMNIHQMAYLSSLWYGEGFNYSAGALEGHGPDWWLIELSGIPFGVFVSLIPRPSQPVVALWNMCKILPWGIANLPAKK